MGKSFAKIHLCSAGKLGDNGSKIPQWVQANGGRYSRQVTQDVTHLVTTKDAYMNNIPAVKEARRFGTVKIVSYEWLENSLLSRNRTPKREKAYLIENILKEERRAAKEKARKTPKQQDKSTNKPGGKFTESWLDHMYVLCSVCMAGLGADATLVRQTITKRNEKFQLTIYESSEEPVTYETECRYSRVGKSNSQILAPAGSSLDTALIAFERFFEEYTGKSWALRGNGILPQPKRDSEGNLLPPYEGWYIYESTTNMFLDFIQKGSASTTDAFGK
ncbi:BRCT domain protein [Aspergillus arachidicola]|uniref:BRCT domain protein n=1 Tax=Aspergillus arachidicola TaxID=656916 RepID=A0A2G7G9N7_9EURO|nr:BRCT domain protein [Aspergillus arachidicola]